MDSCQVKHFNSDDTNKFAKDRMVTDKREISEISIQNVPVQSIKSDCSVSISEDILPHTFRSRTKNHLSLPKVTLGRRPKEFKEYEHDMKK